MRRNNLIWNCCAVVGMLILILDGRTAVTGIGNGTEICIKTLIPTLFPYFVISGILTGSLSGKSSTGIRIMERICKMPEGSGSLLLMGLITGYPVGARNVAEAYSKGVISLDDAQRMAVFCNNAGPAFIFGILTPLFPDIRWTASLWAVQILSAILTGLLMPVRDIGYADISGQQSINISMIMNQAIKSMASVCGWVMFFRMILEFMGKWFFWTVDEPLCVIISGILELTSGCINLGVFHEEAVRFLICSSLLSCGGVCVLLQTASVFAQIDMRQYLAGKLIQWLIGLCLSILTLSVLTGFRSESVFYALIAGASVFLLTCVKRKKEVAIL